MAETTEPVNTLKRKQNECMIADEEEERLAKKLFGAKSLVDDSSDDSEDEDIAIQVQTAEKERKAVWADEDDDVMEEVELPNKKTAFLLKRSTDSSNAVSKQEYQLRLKAAFERVHNAGKKPTWAIRAKEAKQQIEDDESDDEVANALEEMTRTTGKYTEKDILLPRGAIKMSLLPNIQIGHKDFKSVNVLKFHKVKPVLVAGTYSGKIQLYQMDNEVRKDHFLQEISIPRFPITSMDFIAGGNTLLCGSRRQECFIKYDMISGKLSNSTLPKSIQNQNVGKFAISTDGLYVAFAGHSSEVHLLTISSMEHIKSISFSSEVVSVQFTPGSNKELWIMTANGEVFFWDVRACDLHSFVDEGTVKGTCLALSNRGEFLACGSNTGIVNVYDPVEVRASKTPKPLASIRTLTTSCESIVFSNDCQILGSTSSVKSNQVKLMHVRSGTMFANFPQRFEKIEKPTCVNFSPNSGYMAVGTETGLIRAYRIEHFEDY